MVGDNDSERRAAGEEERRQRSKRIISENTGSVVHVAERAAYAFVILIGGGREECFLSWTGMRQKDQVHTGSHKTSIAQIYPNTRQA